MELSFVLICIVAALIGVGISAFTSLLPGLHIYNVIAITMLIAFSAMETFQEVDPLIVTCFIMGLVVGFSVLFTVSGQFFQPCDESFRSIM